MAVGLGTLTEAVSVRVKENLNPVLTCLCAGVRESFVDEGNNMDLTGSDDV
jgi:hypothetical protein